MTLNEWMNVRNNLDEVKQQARHFVPFPSDEDRRLILDEEICIKADPSQPVDNFTGITSAHQFVWIIKRKQ